MNIPERERRNQTVVATPPPSEGEAVCGVRSSFYFASRSTYPWPDIWVGHEEAMCVVDKSSTAHKGMQTNGFVAAGKGEA